MRIHRIALGLIASLVFLAAPSARCADNSQHLNVTVPGGMPGWPMITGVERATNGMTITWDGPVGYYRIYQCKNFKGGSWTQVGGAYLSREATIATTSSNAFFRVSGPSPRYAGAQTCVQCHTNLHTVLNTRHAQAFDALKKIGQGSNPECLVCHTVGYGLPTGYQPGLASATKLEGVQCESCHGPAAQHAANEEDLTL
ncbi:MAG TPA: cytochrome c family protein, partial [Candidatus Paceibacterota bacterium]|nr:cytochrome c family protein [Candidatus Paceibacterota bacterium]